MEPGSAVSTLSQQRGVVAGYLWSGIIGAAIDNDDLINAILVEPCQQSLDPGSFVECKNRGRDPHTYFPVFADQPEKLLFCCFVPIRK